MDSQQLELPQNFNMATAVLHELERRLSVAKTLGRYVPDCQSMLKSYRRRYSFKFGSEIQRLKRNGRYRASGISCS